jgi:hypothetical protein
LRHFVNLALVPFFITLLVSGLLRFLVPFDLTTTRVHVVFGASMLVLVALHIGTRPYYFLEAVKNIKEDRSDIASPRTFVLVIVLWLFFLVAAIWDLPPVPQLIWLSYESRQRHAIFRPDDRSVYEPVEDGMNVKRQADDNASLLVKLDWGPAFPDAYPRSDRPTSDDRPQIAIWAESKNGTLIETLFVSETAAFSEHFTWGGHEQNRADVLPIWRHRYTVKTGIDPSGEEVSWASATPEHSFSVDKYLNTDSDAFYLYVEVNAPKDPNDHYHSNKGKDQPGYVPPGIGQPSILYGALVEPKKNKQYKLLDLVGHGGGGKEEGATISYNLEHHTTARNLIDKVLLRVKRVEPDDSPDASDE